MAPLPHSEAAGGRDVQVYQKESTNSGQKGAGQRLWGWHGGIEVQWKAVGPLWLLGDHITGVPNFL